MTLWIDITAHSEFHNLSSYEKPKHFMFVQDFTEGDDEKQIAAKIR